MATDEVRAERIGDHILKVEINRPGKRNAINGVVAQGIEAALIEAENDRDIRAVILCASGDQCFSSGADLGELAAGRHRDLSTEKGGFAGIVEAKRVKPWIAAVEGLALGGGLEICLACDLIVAGRSAKFGLPEVKRGIIAGAGGVFRLSRSLPKYLANEMLATGEPIGSARAYDLGLVSRVAEDGNAIEVAIELALSIARNAPVAVQKALAVARDAWDRDEAALFDIMRAAGREVMASEDAKEGPRAFVEKREPRWQGR